MTTSDLIIGGLKVGSLPAEIAKQSTRGKAGTDKFWSSTARPIDSNHTEVLELRFGSRRNVNSLAFEVSRFPLVLGVEWQDKQGDWHPFRYRQKDLSARPDLTPRREVPGQPVQVLVSNSVPHRLVNRRTNTGHTQHFGKRHWLPEHWKVNPVTTNRVRFRLKRNHRGQPPVGIHGHPVAYSVALRNVKVGFKVDGPDDLPKGGGEIGSGTDLLDNSILYSLYQQRAERAIDGDVKTAWLCEPQPINYAVVNYILDTRDSNGVGEVLDSFYVEPLTPGVHLNLYHSDDEPVGDFVGSSTPVPALFRNEVGNPIAYTPPGAALPSWQSYGIDQETGDELQTGIGLSSGFVRVDLSQPWWVGLDLIELGAIDGTERPFLSLGGAMLYRQDTDLVFELQSGDSVTIPLDPEVHVTGQRAKILAAYVPATPEQDANLRLAYKVDGYDKAVSALAVDLTDTTPASIRVGLHPDPGSDDISSMGLYGLVLKEEGWTEDTEDWFLEEGADYVADAEWDTDDRHTSTNALIRLHPMWISDTNGFGMVGGNEERLSTGVVWTPVPRDYTLRKGFIHLPPTRARYWKFEFTQLAPHVYETQQTILRTVQVFPAAVIELHSQVGAGPNLDFARGPAASTGDLTTIAQYSKALQTLRTLATTDATPADASALVVKNPQQAADVSSTGWVWQFQPWHTGSLSPGWPVPSVHQYERIPLEHSAKVAYFVGLLEVTPYRTDYRVNDDTPEYVEHFLDDLYIDTDSMAGLDQSDDGVISTSSYATFESETMVSYKSIRGVQFATVQTGKVEVLPDPTFVDPDLSHFYATYGDAQVDRVAEGLVEIQRGWVPITYGDLDQFTYGQLEAMTYGAMEGGLAPGGLTEGGIQTQPYTPIGQGRLDAKVLVSAETDIGPITVEIVAFETNTVVSENTVRLKPGVVTEIDTEFTAGAITTWHTYEDLENFPDISDPDTPTEATYATLEQYTYAELEASLETDTRVYVRVRQGGGTQDSFNVHRIGLYADPIVWSFSVDDGATWFSALDVKNDPNGVMTFPVPGTQFRWKAEFYRDEASVSALHIRPWYGTQSATVHPAHDLASIGPVFSGYDHFPDLYDHPIWKAKDTPVEHIYVVPVDTTQWRNLFPNPGNEGNDTEWIEVDGGTVAIGGASE